MDKRGRNSRMKERVRKSLFTHLGFSFFPMECEKVRREVFFLPFGLGEVSISCSNFMFEMS